MTARSLIVLVFAAGAGFLGARVGATQDSRPTAAPFDPREMMEAMKLAQPGPEHAELMRRAGEWETEIELTMVPGMPAMKQQGRATSRSILGGRFLEVASTGEFMGEPFEGLTLLGFDRRHGEYTLIGLDTLGTYFITARGKREEDGVIRLHGEDDDTSGKQVYTFEYELLDDDTHEYRLLFKELGGQVLEQPFQMMSVRSTRSAG